MGASTEELRRDIADTRSDMSETLDAIGDRVSPGRMIERRKNRMSQGIESMRDRLMGTAHDTSEGIKDMPDTVRERTEGAPMIAGAVAFGFGFLIAALIPTTQKEREMAPALMEKAEPIKQELMDAGREMGEHLAEPAKESMQAIKESASESMQTVVEDAKAASQQTKQQAGAAMENVKSGGDVAL